MAKGKIEERQRGSRAVAPGPAFSYSMSYQLVLPLHPPAYDVARLPSRGSWNVKAHKSELEANTDAGGTRAATMVTVGDR